MAHWPTPKYIIFLLRFKSHTRINANTKQISCINTACSHTTCVCLYICRMSLFFLLVFGSTYVVRLCLFYLDSNCSTYFCSVFFFWTDNLLSCLFSFRHNQLVGRYIFNVIAPMHRRRWLLDRATA